MDSDLGQPWAAYLTQVLPPNIVMTCLALTIVCGFSMGQGCMVAASRVTFAYARDGCFPASPWIARVNKHVSQFLIIKLMFLPDLYDPIYYVC